jgi:cellulose synthase/poly-beta-1,6-N-acetylglucosamine synthase-like glycosyltransferase
MKHVAANYPAVSVVVPSYQASPYIRGILRALLAQDTNFAYEIIVVDSSTDGTERIVEEEFPQVRLLHFPHRCQVGTARNFGIDAAKGDVVLFVDADTIPIPTWIDQMYRAISDLGADGVGGSMSNGTPGKLAGCVGFYLEFFRFLEYNGDPRPARLLVGGNSGFRRQLLKQTRYLDHSVGEDMLLSSRLAQQGKKLLFLPRASIRHLNRTEFRTVFRYQHQVGQGAFLYRSFDAPKTVRLLQWAPPLIFLMPFAVMIWIGGTILLRRRIADFARFAIALPLCLIANFAWASGFLEAMRQAQRDTSLAKTTVPAESTHHAD